MAFNELMPRWRILTIFHFFAINLHTLHLFEYHICNEYITISLINGTRPLDNFGLLYPKLVRLFQISGIAPLHKRNDSIPSLQNTIHPPIKVYFSTNPLG